MNLALFAIKLQLGLIATMIIIFCGFALLTDVPFGYLIGTTLLDFIVFGTLFLFIQKQHNWAAIVYILFAIFSYFRLITSNIDIYSILAFIDVVLSLTAIYGIFSWWRNKSAIS